MSWLFSIMHETGSAKLELELITYGGGGGGGFKPKSDLAISVCVLGGGGGGGVNSLTTMVLLHKLEEEEQNETKTRLFNCCTRGYTNEWNRLHSHIKLSRKNSLTCPAKLHGTEGWRGRGGRWGECGGGGNCRQNSADRIRDQRFMHRFLILKTRWLNPLE